MIKDCKTCFNAGQVLDGPNPACHGCNGYNKWVSRDFLADISDEPVRGRVTGVKYDNGKPQWSLLPFRALGQVVEVLTYGAKKYAPDNWKKVPDARRRYIDAGFRHLTAYASGETNDPETGKHHLAHAICCMLYLVAFDLGEHNDKSNSDI
jgi:hypothetical protein